MATFGDALDPSESTEVIPPVIDALDLGPIGPPRFEFSADHEKLIGDLGKKMHFVGIFLILGSILAEIYAILTGTAFRVDLSAIFQFLMGIWILNAARSFRAIETTKGWDIPNLMTGLGSLRRLFSLIYWLMIAAIVLFGLLLAWVLFQARTIR